MYSVNSLSKAKQSKAKQSKAKQSKAKQSKAKQSHNCLLNNNSNYYISQFFKTLKFLGVRFVLLKYFSSFASASLWERGDSRDYCPPLASNLFSLDCFISFAMTINNNFAILNLVKTFLTSLTFDNLSERNLYGYKKFKSIRRFLK